ncbi:MAG: glycosyltransferase family 4 protein [Lysobacterales bacterium]
MSEFEVSEMGRGVLVAQLGARRHYAVPMAFQAHGQLHALCTDLFLRSPWQIEGLRRLAKLLGYASIRRLADRQSGVELGQAMIRRYPMFGLQYKWQGARAASAAERTANWLWGGKRFASLCASAIDERTGSVYAFTSAAKELFETAQARGLPRWLDYATAPRAFEVGLIAEEAERFPGWAARPVDDALTDAYLQRQREEMALATRIVCGSSFAKRAIVAEGADPQRVVVVPLGLARHLYIQDTRGRPVESNIGLRVLYVGGDGLRKGIGYLAQALELLDRGDIQARAAGDLELSALALGHLSKRIELLGTVARSDMALLFAWADVLVLPSISDTFGMVILEAMAAGVPVIASENTSAPDLIRDGVDGFVVPIRDAPAIARALQLLADEPERRRAIAQQARTRAAEFSVAHYGARLMRALNVRDAMHHNAGGEP